MRSRRLARLGLFVLSVVVLAALGGLLAGPRGRAPSRGGGSRAALADAREALTRGRAGAAEDALERASAADPSDPEPWRLLLELLRVEDRMTDAQRVGLKAEAAVPAGLGRVGVLRAWTLGLLADLPDDLARETLSRWAGLAGPDDPDARVALLRRYGASPRSGDPDRDARVAELSAVLDRHPGHVAAREALAADLADGGEPDRGRAVLDAWPETLRDARYWRLRGRWDLEFDARPGPAAEAFARALAELPHDWKTRVRLARALRKLGREDEARREAEAVSRLRERLDPIKLGPRLSDDLRRAAQGERPAMEDLAAVCAGAGLPRLSEAWHAEAARPPSAPLLPGR